MEVAARLPCTRCSSTPTGCGPTRLGPTPTASLATSGTSNSVRERSCAPPKDPQNGLSHASLFHYSGPDPETCAQNCALDAGDYEGTYGISTQGNSLKLQYVVPESDGMTDVGSRTYLMQDDSNYQVFIACWACLHPRNAWFSLNSSPCPTHAHLQTDVPLAQPGVHL